MSPNANRLWKSWNEKISAKAQNVFFRCNSRLFSAMIPARARVKSVISRLADTLVCLSNPAVVAASRHSGRALGCSGKGAARRSRVPEEMRLHSFTDLWTIAQSLCTTGQLAAPPPRFPPAWAQPSWSRRRGWTSCADASEVDTGRWTKAQTLRSPRR